MPDNVMQTMNSIFMILLFLFLLAVGFGIIFRLFKSSSDAEKTKLKRISDSEKQYRQALSALRKSPNNAELRQKALRFGRRYAELARENKRTVFDEVALMNDLNAIPTIAAEPGDDEESTNDVEERLIKLEQLYSKGLITAEEYSTRRNTILDEI